MKKLIIAAIAGCILTLVSCSSGSSVFSAGTWSYKGTTYNAYSAVGSATAKSLVASYANTGEVDNVECYFYSWPPAAGTYTIVNTQGALTSSGNRVYIVMNIGTKVYTLDNSSASTAATVSVSSDNKVTISVAGATFSIVSTSATDSGPFTLSVAQNL